MKKMISLVLCAVLVLSMAACSANANNSKTNTNSLTVNGITRTEKTSTVNGQTTHEITYKDADGNELDPEIGKAAFEAAQNGIENPLEYVTGVSEETKAPSYKATVHFQNDMEQAITELSAVYVPNGDESGNLLTEGDPLLSGETLTVKNFVSYPVGAEMQITIVTESGDKVTFDPVAMGGQENLEDMTFVFTEDAEKYYIDLK